MNKSGRGSILLKVFNGYAYTDKKKSAAQNLHSRCGMTHVHFSLKNR